MAIDNHDKAILGSTTLTAAVGAILVVIGFVIRFGRGFGDFVTYAKKDSDFLELKRLDMIFGLFTAAGILLVILLPLAIIGTLRSHAIALKMYAAAIGLMIVVQLVVGLLAFTYSDEVNKLANYDTLNESINRTVSQIQAAGNTIPSNSDEATFWKHTQKQFKCCGIEKGLGDWGDWGTQNPKLVTDLNCLQANFNTWGGGSLLILRKIRLKGCEKKIRDRISQDAQYLGASAMGVLLVEIIAAFLTGWKGFII